MRVSSQQQSYVILISPEGQLQVSCAYKLKKSSDIVHKVHLILDLHSGQPLIYQVTVVKTTFQRKYCTEEPLQK